MDEKAPGSERFCSLSAENHTSKSMAHHHGHHHHGQGDFHRAFAVGVALNVIFIVVEILFGILSGSLALLADAGHNLSDVLGLLLAWGASVLSQRTPTQRRTYGLRRTSILAALMNAGLLLVAIGGIAWEAVHRFATPAPVAGLTVMVVAGLGVLINGITALMFMGGRKGDLNIRGAYLHMAADAAVSLGVVVAGLLIVLTRWHWLDPLTTLVIVIVIGAGTWNLLKESLDLALDAVPEGIDPVSVREYLESLPGVTEVHDLHIWGMSTTEAVLTAHLVRPGGAGDDSLLARVCHDLHDRYGIEHATLQIEHGDENHPCRLASSETV